jgi:hypothetical protein
MISCFLDYATFITAMGNDGKTIQSIVTSTFADNDAHLVVVPHENRP